MGIEQLMQGILAHDPESIAVAVTWSPEQTSEVIATLHAEVERYFYINPNRSLEIAQQIEQIGQRRADQTIRAIGLLKQADAFSFLGQLDAAWSTFATAGAIMLDIGDEVGWARTRIGRLLLCVDLDHVAEALVDAERARTILARNDLADRLFVLDLHLGIVHKQLGSFDRALDHYNAALKIAQQPTTSPQPWLASLYTNFGNVYSLLGDYHKALAFHLDAQKLFVEREEPSGVAMAGMNVAHIYMAQGQYRPALRLLHDAAELYRLDDQPRSAAFVRRDLAECLLVLNRFDEALELAQQVSTAFAEFGAGYEQGQTLLHLATAAAALGDFPRADVTLAQAAHIFASLGAHNWIGTVLRCQGQIAYRLGDLDAALWQAEAAEARFEASSQPIEVAATALLRGRIAFAQHDLATAHMIGRSVQCIAQRSHVPTLRYAAHMLLGNVAEAQGQLHRARRRYEAAVTTVEQVQQRLTITLRPGFLGDKEEALHALIGLYLKTADVERAFATLERAKSQVFLNHLVDREQLHWRTDDPHTQALLSEVEQLRSRHHWLYGIANDSMTRREQQGEISIEQARADLAVCERRIRMLTEQLYLQGDDRAPQHFAPRISHHTIQQHLGADTVLVEYYSDSTGITAFVLDAQRLHAHRLPMTPQALDQTVAQLQLNINAALTIDAASPLAGQLCGAAQVLLKRLYDGLLAPVMPGLRDHRRLVIVPYGIMHYVPMHLLYTGKRYVIEQKEVVVMPAAGLMTRTHQPRQHGATVLAHSWQHRLPHTIQEATMVHDRFPGVCWIEDAARRTRFHGPPTQILHIAAHAAYRLDQPDLSYIELADGQVFADDLMQEDMSYELVTLSACETGRARVSAGDELIGLGRGFLYGGAGACVASLWRVADTTTIDLMDRFYQGLYDGASKAAALRDAQCAIKRAQPNLHPAFWGAFQLIGDPRPLSQPRST